MRIYTIVGGVNGVGKSSLSGVLKAERRDLGPVIDVDKIAVTRQCAALEAEKIALSQIDEYIEKGISFTQETTLSGQRTAKTIKAAKDKGYYIRLFYIGLSTRGECVKRIQNRVEKGGHNIEESDVSRRYAKRFVDLTKILPYCDEAHLFDNENGFTEIAEYKNGELIPKGTYTPCWYKELSEVHP